MSRGKSREPSPTSSILSRFGQLLVRREYILFLLVGVYNTVVGYGVFALVHAMGKMHYLVTLLIAHVISVINAFFAYRLIVFKVRGHLLLDFFRFWSVYLVSLSMNLALLPSLVELADLPVLQSQAVSLFIIAVISYLGHKHFSFRRSVTAREDLNVEV